MIARKHVLLLDDAPEPQPARRRRRIWTCAVCGAQSVWLKGWTWYGSARDEDEDGALIEHNACCSEECRAKHVPVRRPNKGEALEIARKQRKARKGVPA